MTDEKALTIIQDAPLAQISREQFENSVARLRAILPDGPQMSVGQLSAVAMHSLLTGTIPGDEVYYFLNGGKLCKTEDYKLVKRWAVESERRRTGDAAATISENYAVLTSGEARAEGLAEGDIAVWCTVVSSYDQPQVKRWIDAGLTSREAFDLVGTKAIGVIKKAELGNIPKGWSPMQKARKLALKNALRFRFGKPSPFELQQQAKSLARGDVTEGDWEEVPANMPPEVQARYAELTAVARQVTEAGAELLPDEHVGRLQSNADLLRGADEGAIGEEQEPGPDELFFMAVCRSIPYFRHPTHVKNTIGKLGLSYDPAQEDALLDALDVHARRRADEKAGAVQGQMFEGQPVSAGAESAEKS